MSSTYIVGTVLVMFILFKFAFAQSIDPIKLDEAKKLIENQSAIVVDVREPSEVKEGKLTGAVVIPMSLMNSNKEEFSKKVDQFSKEKTILLYCRSGRRSGIVGSELKKLGYKVYNLGGFDSLKSNGFKTE